MNWMLANGERYIKSWVALCQFAYTDILDISAKYDHSVATTDLYIAQGKGLQVSLYFGVNEAPQPHPLSAFGLSMTCIVNRVVID